MFVENRRDPRVAMALRLKVGAGIDAVTRDVSPSGLYIELPGEHVIDGTLFFELDLEEANMKFTAEGTVVRVEHRNGCTGIAVKLVAGRLQSIA
ncbi:MAG TPA: PilZ domain-containing protein [Ramlibacter sp.]|nr:PilZ domain-containing protein [Ramlibacter sp.]